MALSKEEKRYIIYGHKCKTTGKWYIGQTSQSAIKRWGGNGQGYLSLNEAGEYRQPKFALAIEKYGWDDFEHVILEDNLLYTDVDTREQYWISEKDSVNNGYNLTSGGVANGHNYGTHVGLKGGDNPTAKAIIMLDSKTKKPLKKFDSVTEALKYVSPSSESTSSLSKAASGKYNTLFGYSWKYDDGEDVPDMSDIEIKKYQNLIVQKIAMVSIDGNHVLHIFENGVEASKFLGFDKRITGISKACTGETSQYEGFNWRFATDNDILVNLDLQSIEDCNIYRRKRQRQVGLIDPKTNNVVKVFNSLTEAAEKTGASLDNIKSVVVGKREHCNNFKFRYIEAYEDISLMNLEITDYSIYKMEFNKKETRIDQFTLDGQFIKRFNSIKEAIQELNLKSSHITECCLGKRKSAHGYTWKYVDAEKPRNTK